MVGRKKMVKLTKEWLLEKGFQEIVVEDTTGHGYIDEIHYYKTHSDWINFSFDGNDLSLSICDKWGESIAPDIEQTQTVEQVEILWEALTGTKL
jgi:hypothetical protein